MNAVPRYESLVEQSRLILDSYEHWLQKPLIKNESLSPLQIAESLFEANFPVLSAESGPDPYLNYGNKKTLELWELSWEQLLKTRGKETAETMERESRASFLKEVDQKGYVENYEGIRISRTGKRFFIKNVCVWKVLDIQGNPCGQAATFKDWEYL